MVTTRSTARKLKTSSTSDNDGSKSWSNLNYDLLVLIMMQVGVFDFVAFCGVCKAWRSVAVSNWNKFMVSKQPMHLSISDRTTKKECYLEDYTRRKLKNMIPHSSGRMCVGLTCGYLIFMGCKTRDLWLVNPITRKELHFPVCPLSVSAIPANIKGTLVFSPLMSGWVFVMLPYRGSNRLYFCLADKQSRWSCIYSSSSILDLHFFKGKIYTLHTFNHLFELRINPVPSFTQQKMKNFPWLSVRHQKFVSSAEKLYVMDMSTDDFNAIEVNFDEMEWMNTERTIEEYAVFVSDLKGDAAIKPETWAHPWTQYERLNYAGGDQSKKKGRCLTTNMWYFPSHCLNGNNSDTENGTLLNFLEE